MKKLLIALALSTTLLPRTAVAEVMSFSGTPPRFDLAPMMGTAWTIYADGEIDAEAGERLEQFITFYNVPSKSYIYLNSPGGNVGGGVKLGRVIRKYGLRTNVAVRALADAIRWEEAPGECMSACSFAFLGGPFRYLTKGSKYGVHRFAWNDPRELSPERSSDGAQMVSAVIVEYIKSMDVDPKLFSLMVTAGADEMFEPTRAQLTALNVVNNGYTTTKWSIESMNIGLYLKGERDTVYGVNKFILMCDGSNLRLHVIFDAQRREDEILAFARFHSLMIDEEPASELEAVDGGAAVHNGWINAAYTLTDKQVSLIRRAETVGVTMQWGPDAPMFWGFNSMPFADGRAKLQGFLNTCWAKPK